jgi:hypothetical protein
LASRLPTCVLTVASLTNKVPAISVLLPPRASSTRTSRSRTVSEASRDGAGMVCGGRCANASIRRRVTVGASMALPAAAARTAAMRSARGESLSRNPLAPARSASYTYSSRSKVVSMTTLGVCGPSEPPVSSRVASSPSMPGMRMSMSTTSGWCAAADATAAAPSAASPTTVMPSAASRMTQNPERTSS